jgi:hypothetical protein
MRAAVVDAQIVADAMHTILCLGAQKVPEMPAEVPIDAFWPLEAEKLHYPQTQFFSSPYWGHPRVGSILAGGTKAVPLKLKLDSGEKEFIHGISAGMGKSLTFVLPKGVFRRFTVLAGLHPELGAKGRVEFTIHGDGKPLTSITLNGTDAAQKLECELSGVSQLQLMLTGRGLDSKSNYAIWAEPSLMR